MHRQISFTSAKLKRRMEKIEASISRYLAAFDAADRHNPSASAPDTASPEEKIAKFKEQMKKLQGIEAQLNESPDKQVSLTAPGTRSMMTHGSGIVGYNVQIAVDTQHHLIVAHEVINKDSDRDQLSSMAKQLGKPSAQKRCPWLPTEATSKAKKSWPATMPTSPPMCRSL